MPARPRTTRRALAAVRALAAAVAVAAVAGCSGGGGGDGTGGGDGAQALEVQVLARFPHDPGAFTQGLQLDGDRLFESTGLRGRSTLRQVDLATGEVVRRVDLPPDQFGEGLALVGDHLVQLTWQEGTATVWDADTFEQVGSFSYEGEGWGLCYDGTDLVMSDGSPRLTRRDPGTFAVRSTVEVRRDGRPVDRLNELECVGERVYANVYQTDDIVEVGPDGTVVATVDASGLLPAGERPPADVLNGIAYVAERDTFLLTGKSWPTLFEVAFVPS